MIQKQNFKTYIKSNKGILFKELYFTDTQFLLGFPFDDTVSPLYKLINH